MTTQKKPEEKRIEELRSRDALAYSQVGRSKESVAKGGLGGKSELRKSLMMARMLDALEADPPVNIGHYGRLVFTMVARHFLTDMEMTTLMIKQPGEDELTVSSRGTFSFARLQTCRKRFINVRLLVESMVAWGTPPAILDSLVTLTGGVNVPV